MNEVEQRLKERFKKEFYVDYGLIFIVLFLLAFGLVMLYSTSSYEANLELGDSTYYFKHQLAAIGAGVGVWGVINLLEGYGNDNPGANAHVR
jgi:cell division protein FtsW